MIDSGTQVTVRVPGDAWTEVMLMTGESESIGFVKNEFLRAVIMPDLEYAEVG